MKKIIALLAAFIILITSVGASAMIEPTGANTGSDKGRAWLEKNQADVYAHRILDGNIAFVRGSKRAWANSHVEVMDSEAVYNADSGTFSLPSSFVNRMFGTNFTTDSANSDDITNETDYNSFTDPRGFIVFSKKSNPINTSVPASSYTSYKDFFPVADAMCYITWEDREFTKEEREAYIAKWRGALSIPDDCDRTKFTSFLKSQSDNGIKEMKKAKKGEYNAEKGRYYYIPDRTKLDGYDLSSSGLKTFKVNLLAAYKRVLTMATGYACMSEAEKSSSDGTELLNATLGSLDFLLKYYSMEWDILYESKQQWTDTQFNIPIVAGNILCLMYDKMSEAEIKEYTDQIFDKAPLPNIRTGYGDYGEETYTNRLWKSYSYFNVAVLANDAYKMNYAIKYSAPAYMYTYSNASLKGLKFNKDGFYTDGSMIFHNNIPNNMGYGLSYVTLVYEMLALTSGTKFDIRDTYDFENVYSFAVNNILPFVSNGITMRMTHGRANPLTDTAVISRIMYISNYAGEPVRKHMVEAIKKVSGSKELKASAKQYIVNTPMLSEMADEYNSYAANVSVHEEDKTSSKVYYNQDQVVHRTENFTAALSMSSERVAKYESILPTNAKGWYLGDGMLYIYKDGTTQYDSSYFSYVNPYYMPGTTVDSTVRKEITTNSSAENWGNPDNKFAGGASDGKNTAAGYILGNKYVSGLKGKKSYFMIGDKIICMGSGITGGEGNVYTVIDNRVINKPSGSLSQPDTAYKVKEIICSNPAKQEAASLFTDGNITTSSAQSNIGDTVTFDFGERVKLQNIAMAFLNGSARKEYGVLQISDDGESFTDVYNLETSGTTTDFELYEIPCEGRYFRVVANGNSAGNSWFNLSEIVFYKPGTDLLEIEKNKNVIYEGYDRLVINGEEETPDFNTAHSNINSEWAWLENTGGIVFLQSGSLEYIREKQTEAPCFMRITLNHGTRPKAEKYAYIILPNASENETKAYSENGGISVLEQSEQIHLIYDKENDIYAFNLFSGTYSIGGFTFKAPCSAIINKNNSTVCISDPTLSAKDITVACGSGIKIAPSASYESDGSAAEISTLSRPGKTTVINYKEEGAPSDNSEKKTISMKMRFVNHAVSTLLYTGSGKKAEFEITSAPTAGYAYINGNKLTYCPLSEAVTDAITVKAADSDGKETVFNITVEKKGGTSGEK